MTEAEEIQVLRQALKESTEERDLLRSKLEKLLRFVKEAGDRACTQGHCLTCGRGGFDHKGQDRRVATTFAGQCKSCATADPFDLELLRRAQWKREAAEIIKGGTDADPK